MVEFEQPSRKDWTFGKYDFCDEPKDCLTSLFCPCYYASVTAQNVDPIDCGLMPFMCPCLIVCFRNEARDKLNIDGSFGGDCLSFMFCQWSYTRFSCCDSCKDVLISLCCLNCYMCATAQMVEPDSCCGIIVCFCPIALICVRGRAREKKNIEGSFIGDCISFMICPCCTTIQMNREFLPDFLEQK